MTRQIIVGVVIALVSGFLVAVPGYLFVVKKNQVDIVNLQREVDRLKDSGREYDKSLVATKLFIAQAHPDRDISNFASLQKLQDLNAAEIRVLAGELQKAQLTSGPQGEIVSTSNKLQQLIQRFQFNDDDLETYQAVAEMPSAGDQR